MNDSDKAHTTYQIRLWLRDDQQADFMAWLAEHDRQVKAEAWAEGFMDCANWWEIHHANHVVDEKNPYLNGDNN
jgi:predicted acetyltransferase